MTNSHDAGLRVPNERAMALARSACGHPNTIRGDVFVSRIFENQEEGGKFQRMNFRKDEADPSAAWCGRGTDSSKVYAKKMQDMKKTMADLGVPITIISRTEKDEV